MTTPIDWTDACSRAEALKVAYFELLAGRQAYEITYQANGVSRSVKYSIIDMERLAVEIRSAERECAGAAARSSIGISYIRSEKGFL